MKRYQTVKIIGEYTINMENPLGQGSTGCVYEGYHINKNNKVAIKIINLHTIDNIIAFYLLDMQKTALMIINHPYIVHSQKITQDHNYCYLITQYYNGGTLKNQIKTQPLGYLPQSKAMPLFHYLLLAQKYLIEKGIYHRDLKPTNIMLHNNKPKIIDFGYCQIKGFSKPIIQYNVGSPSYMAPQSFTWNIYNEKTQIWALGMILYEMLTGKTIDNGRHMSQVYLQMQRSGIPYPNHISYRSRNIINWCFNKNPKNRPTCLQLLTAYFPNKNRAKSNFISPILHSPLQLDPELEQLHNSPKQLPPQQFLSNPNNYYTNKILNCSPSDFLPHHKNIYQDKQNSLKCRINLRKPFTHTPAPNCHLLFPQYEQITCSSAREIQINETNYEYRKKSHPTNISKVIQSRNINDVQQLYDKIYRTNTILTKNRVLLSNPQQMNQYYKYQQISNNQRGYNIPKQYFVRTKRIVTENNNLFQACI